MRHKEKLIIALILIIFLSSSVYVIYTLLGHKSPSLPDRDSEQPLMPVEERQAQVRILPHPEMAPLNPKATDYVITDIITLADDEGLGFCQSLEDEHLKQVCIERHWLKEAERLGDPSVCDMCTYPGFIRQCKLQAATVAVATEYYRLFMETGDEFAVPDNIGICDQLEYEDDKKVCSNPKGAIERNRYELMYRLMS